MIKNCSGYHARKETLKHSPVIVTFDLFIKAFPIVCPLNGCCSEKMVLVYGGSVVHIFSLVSDRYSL